MPVNFASSLPRDRSLSLRAPLLVLTLALGLAPTLSLSVSAAAEAKAAASTPPSPPAREPNATPAKIAPNTSIDFAALHALPFPELRAALERAGWPAPHVRAFVETEIQWRLNPPLNPTAAELRPFEFWRTGPDAEPLPPATLRARALEQERREAAVRTANETVFPSADGEIPPALAAWNDDREWGKLSPPKREALLALYRRVDEARQAIFQPRGGQLNAAEWREVQKLAQKSRDELAALLTPEELLDHDLRSSPTANQLRRDLDAMAPTREEFLAIFRLRFAHELKFDLLPRGSLPELEDQRPGAEEKLETALEAALGKERYADYRLSLQPPCQLLQFDGRFAQASAATVRRLYREFLAAKERHQTLDTLPESERVAEQTKLKAALHASFRTVLDEEATRRYLQEQGLWP